VKLLLDQNLSYRLVKKLGSVYSDIQQIKRIGFNNKPDRTIWDFAKAGGYTIVTFDSDFYDLSLLFGHPPKLIWLRCADQTTRFIENVLKQKYDQIYEFVNDQSLSCLEIID
jgi:predicted nuclease of predicted toxin-antitoxin system